MAGERRTSSPPPMPTFDHVEPYSQACPDCGAKIGEKCTVKPDYLPDTMVHIRRCFTAESDASIKRYYEWEREQRT